MTTFPLRARANGFIATAAATALGVGAAVAITMAPSAGAETLCTTEQLTDSAPSATVSTTSGRAIDADGDTIAFLSDRDPLGTNPDGNEEVFLHRVGEGLTQATTSTGAGNLGPGISDDGQRVVFSSTLSYGGINVDGNREVFLYDDSTEQVTNLSTTVGGGSTANGFPDISGDGAMVTYQSNQNPLGQNADANQEIFYKVIGVNQREQVTQTTGGANTLPSFDDDHDEIVFVSNRDLVPTTNADGNQELFTFDLSSETFERHAGSTGGTGVVNAPDPNATASSIAFTHDRALGQENSDAGLDASLLVRPSALAGVTEGPSGRDTSAIASSASGSRLALASEASPVGTNTDGNGEIFVWDQAGADFTQITVEAGDSSFNPSISEPGDRVAFTSRADIGGGNPGGGLDLFVAACSTPGQVFADVAPSHPFFDEIGWMEAAFISTGTPASPLPLYKPSAAVSRSAMSAFMFRLAGSPAFTPPGIPTFGDVAPSHPFFDEIEWMADEGITTGTPASPKPLYKPSDAVSRSAMSAFMFRLAGEPAFPDPATSTFTDVTPTHPFFTEIEWMANEGITTGFQPGPTYAPAAAVSRQAMSAFMFRLADGPGVDLTSG